MHPVNYLFEEINRAHWGMTLGNERIREGRRPAASRVGLRLGSKRG